MRLLTLAAVLVALAPIQAWAGGPDLNGFGIITVTNGIVPEPTSLALLAVGLGGVSLSRFRRRRRK